MSSSEYEQRTNEESNNKIEDLSREYILENKPFNPNTDKNNKFMLNLERRMNEYYNIVCIPSPTNNKKEKQF